MAIEEVRLWSWKKTLLLWSLAVPVTIACALLRRRAWRLWR